MPLSPSARPAGAAAILVCTLALGPLAPAAGAHHSVEDALAGGAGPPEWASIAGAYAALAAILCLVLLRLRRLGSAMERGRFRYGYALAQVLALWLLVGYLQSATARSTGTAGPLLTLGYIVLPLAIAMVWFYVIANFRQTLRLVLSAPAHRWTAIAVGLAFAGIYLWAGNLVGVPEPDDLPEGGAPRDAFVTFFAAYGPLAVWPNVEFWLPQLSLFGSLSLGVGMVVVTVATLMGLNWAGIAFLIGRRPGGGLGWRAGGLAALGPLATNFCCCCAPAAYPLLALVLGTTTASSVGAWLVGSASPFYNLAQVAMIAFLLAAMGSLRRRVDAGAATPIGSSGAA